jgi:hypothetical protein
MLTPACDPPVVWPQPKAVPIKKALDRGASVEEAEEFAREVGLLEPLVRGARSYEARNR